MSDTLQPGLSLTRKYDIDAARTIAFMGDECRVYSTPALLYDIEVCCRDLLLQHIGEGKDSVGTRVELDHVGATLLGRGLALHRRARLSWSPTPRGVGLTLRF